MTGGTQDHMATGQSGDRLADKGLGVHTPSINFLILHGAKSQGRGCPQMALEPSPSWRHTARLWAQDRAPTCLT